MNLQVYVQRAHKLETPDVVYKGSCIFHAQIPPTDVY